MSLIQRLNFTFRIYSLALVFIILFLFIHFPINAQTPGYIFNPASTVSFMDPNLDHFTSSTTAGFTSDDLSQSEIAFFPLPKLGIEPSGDLRRGSSGGVTDIVHDANGNGAYIYYDGTNLIFRIRSGGYSNGAFGFSILIDADMKFGNVGPCADPNYQAQTTGSNGNAGFEYEITLEKNFRVGVYNVDGGSSPVLIGSYLNESTHTQASKAFTTNDGNADYFIDFYVPLSALNNPSYPVNSSTTLRMVATTSMNAAPAIGGTKSDIYGVDDRNYPVVEEAWTTLINSQPGFSLTQVGSGGTGTGALCTAPPAVTAIATGATTLTGTWTATSSATTATISIYRNGSFLGTTTATSGIGWSYTLSMAASPSDTFYAIAQATGESACLQSNTVTVQDCTPATTTVAPIVSCFSDRGAQGTMVSGATVKIYQVLAISITLVATTGSIGFSYPTTTSWVWESTNANPSNPCGGSSPDVADGTYYVTATSGTNCQSGESGLWCVGLKNTTAIPVITQTQLYNSTTTVSGTSANPTTVRLFINGRPISSVSSTGTFSFTGLTLNLGDVVDVTAQATSQCSSGLATRTVTCYTSAPVINADATGKIAAGIVISGSSSENSGTITVYRTSDNTSVGSATVSGTGTWATSYLAVAGLSYYAVLTSGPCSPSGPSATVSVATANSICPTITTPVNEGAANVVVTGTTSGQTVRLYEDGSKVGEITASGSTTTITLTAGYSLYAGGLLTVTTQTAATIESSCLQNITVACVAPATPSVPITSYTICNGSAISVSVSSSISGVIYTLRNDAGTTDLSTSLLGTGGIITLTSSPLTTPSPQTLNVNASKAGNYVCQSNSSITAYVNNVSDGIVASDQSVIYGGDPAAFTVTTPSTGSGTLSYQWQSSITDNFSGFSNFSGATSATYDPPSGLTQTTWYKRITTSTLNSTPCTATSNVVKVTVVKTFNCATTDWNVATNWSPNGVPLSTDNVIIPCEVHVNTLDAVCNNITITSAGTLVINAGEALTVSGSISNDSGNDGLVLKSDASSGTANLITSSTNVPATVERYISKYTSSTDLCYHYISSPVTGQSIAGIFNLASLTDDLYLFDEVNYLWVNAKNGSGGMSASFLALNNGSTDFQLGKGYMISLAADATKLFVGILNSTDVSVNLTYSQYTGKGFNMIGNPFPASLNLASSAWSTLGMCGGFYAWDCVTQSYKYSNGGVGTLTIIAPEQGFFVHTFTTGAYIIPAAARVIGISNILKTAEQVPDVLKLILQGKDSGDETYIRFADDATEGFDCHYDVYKFGETAGVPFFYSQTAESKMAINALPTLAEKRDIALGIKVSAESTYTMALAENTTPGDYDILLEDTKDAKTIKLNDNQGYTFTVPAGDNTDRFILHISKSGSTGIPETLSDQVWKIRYFDNTLAIDTKEGMKNAVLYLSDMTGRVLDKESLDNIHSGRFHVRFAPGVYLVTIRAASYVKSQKIMIY